MKDGLENIDEVFKQAFDGFEANVDPSVWANVQSSISSGGVMPQADPVSSTVSTSIVKSVVVKIAAAVLTVGTIATATYYIATSPSEKEAIAENTIVEDVVLEETPIEKTEVVIIETNEEEKEPVERQVLVTKEKTLDKTVEKTTELAKEKEENTIPKVEEQNFKNTTNFGANNKTSDSAPVTEDKSQKSSTVLVVKDDKKPEDNNKPTTEPSVTSPSPEPKPEVKKEALVDPIPKVFSPNGDGQNDVIKITGENLEKLEVVVMDKTGKIVYKINNIEQEWNGKDQNGFDLIPGTYYMAGVVVDTEGNVKNIKQVINLFK